MLIPALAAALAFAPGPPVDTAAVYAAVLQTISEERPSRSLVLSRTLCEPRTCDPLFDGVDPKLRLSWEAASDLLARGLVRRLCRIEEDSLGCPDLTTDEVMVGLAPVMDESIGLAGPAAREFSRWPAAEGDVWVTAFTYAPCRSSCRYTDASAYRYLLRHEEGGAWRVLQRTPVG